MMNPFKRGLSEVLSRITNKLQQDSVVNITLHELRDLLRVDRVVLYYFYKQWQGQVTFEAISDRKYSIIGSTGPDDCFNVDYALLYLAGRINSIDDIEKANISDCHRDFLRGLLVRSNLVAPVLSKGKLWGLLVAHQCHDLRAWQPTDIEAIRKYSDELATAPSIRDYTN
ncbi:GAF domain-containing protein [Pseudanabaena sp. 'Roaring Creek']|uniref:GAF domain-containing protein n=1 Tax=Pseudanabaena sp. 'Roaring Creek' TaxID=1681830 RepID=UPI0006D8375C